MVHLVIRVIEDQQTIATAIIDATSTWAAVHESHGPCGADGRRQDALTSRQAAAVTRRQAEE
jgi:hypothetical protein